MSVKSAVEALLFASEQAIPVKDLCKLADAGDAEVRAALEELADEYRDRGVELKEVASGFRFQTKAELATQVARLWEEKPPRYSKAMLETIAIIAYCQPITRAQIEATRGVSTQTKTMRTLEERGWIKEAGRKETPGRPTLYATTDEFLDYFNLRSLDELPALTGLDRLKALHPDLATAQAHAEAGEPEDDRTPDGELKSTHDDEVTDASG